MKNSRDGNMQINGWLVRLRKAYSPKQLALCPKGSALFVILYRI